jgi:drug/metabolite transporter (DMT)-like permease
MATNDAPAQQHKAGLFDIRFIIGALLGVYGVILLLTGLIGTDHHVSNSKAINIWGGVALVLAAAFFAVWSRLRPIVVPDHVDGADDRPAVH